MRLNRIAIFAIGLFASACEGSGKTATPPVASAATTATTFFGFEAVPLGGVASEPLAKYEGNVLLVANTAAHCGYTPQYKPLGEVDRKYSARGFRVLGFVSDDFGHQAGSVDEIKACSLDNRAAFDQFAEMHVKIGAHQHPLFGWLTSRPGMEGDVKWNFNKWLIGKSGELLARWDSKVLPDAPEVTQAIEKALGDGK